MHFKSTFTLLSILFFAVCVSCKQSQNGSSKKSEDCDYVKNYFPKIYAADIAYEQENFKKAYELYKAAFDHCQPLNMIGFDEMEKYAKASAEEEQYQSTYNIAKELVSIGMETDFFEKWHVFQGFVNSKYGQKFYDEYVDLKEVYKKRINLDLRQQILYMIDTDKKYNGSDIAPEKRDSLNLENAQELKQIFEKYGYPNTTKIGIYEVSHEYTNISNILTHVPDSMRINYFIPKLREFVKDGQTPPRVLASMVDQYRIDKGQGQRYGTYVKNDGSFYKLYHDLEQVDKDRKSIGMPTIVQERQRNNLLRAK